MKGLISKIYFSLILDISQFQKSFLKWNINWLKIKMNEFQFCLYSFIDFKGEIDKRDEKKSKGVEHWEPH